MMNNPDIIYIGRLIDEKLNVVKSQLHNAYVADFAKLQELLRELVQFQVILEQKVKTLEDQVASLHQRIPWN